MSQYQQGGYQPKHDPEKYVETTSMKVYHNDNGFTNMKLYMTTAEVQKLIRHLTPFANIEKGGVLVVSYGKTGRMQHEKASMYAMEKKERQVPQGSYGNPPAYTSAPSAQYAAPPQTLQQPLAQPANPAWTQPIPVATPQAPAQVAPLPAQGPGANPWENQ